MSSDKEENFPFFQPVPSSGRFIRSAVGLREEGRKTGRGGVLLGCFALVLVPFIRPSFFHSSILRCPLLSVHSLARRLPSSQRSGASEVGERRGNGSGNPERVLRTKSFFLLEERKEQKHLLLLLLLQQHLSAGPLRDEMLFSPCFPPEAFTAMPHMTSLNSNPTPSSVPPCTLRGCESGKQEGVKASKNERHVIDKTCKLFYLVLCNLDLRKISK